MNWARRAVYIVALLLLIVPASIAQERFSPALESELDAIEAVAVAYRQLARREETALNFPTADEVADHLAERFDRDYPPERLDQIYLFYRALDLAEPDVDLRELMLAFMGAQIAGYYDSETQTMQVILPAVGMVGDRLDTQSKVIYAHEYAHALQDQHFGLAQFAERRRDASNLDVVLALTALVEGDASLVMDHYLDTLFREDPILTRIELQQAQVAAAAIPVPPDLPRVIEAEIAFAYLEGRAFVQAVYDALGWEGINRAFRENPPTTSEQILHPERYLAGEGALAVRAVDASGLIKDGWQVAYDDVVGEFYLRQHLARVLDAPVSERLAEGWGGDRLQVFTRSGQAEMVCLWVIRWDRAEEAEEFAAGYGRYLERRGDQTSGDGRCRGGAVVYCFARVGAVETRISRAVDEAVARALLREA